MIASVRAPTSSNSTSAFQTLEGIARAAHNLSVPAGAAIVRQGEPGDRYYAIAEGTVEVIKDGRPVATRGRGEGFGEIALLHGGMRTATVIPVTAATLTPIEREPFLVAVTGHSQTRERFEHVASSRLLVDLS
jgi:CRP-like cAMP-binding protein